jgi:TRAP-type C4-dicarboxylate transport system permease small subunit
MFLKFCDAVAKALERILVALGVILLIMVALQVAGRYIPSFPAGCGPSSSPTGR